MGILLGVVAFACIAIIGFKLIKSQKPNVQKPAPSNFEAPSKDMTQEKKIEQVMNSLLSLNLIIRTDHTINRDLITSIEKIIDDIRLILPSMMERYPAESLTYELEKIGSSHLKKIVKEYLDLSESSRENQHDIFTSTIENLGQITNRSKQIIENNETAEFKTMAHFLAGKFSS